MSTKDDKKSIDFNEKILLFLSNGVRPEESLELFRSLPVFNILLFLGVGLLVIFGSESLIGGDKFWGGMDIVISLALVLFYFSTKQLGLKKIYGHIILSVFYIFFILIGVTGGTGYGYLWVFFFPIAATFLVGPKKGLIWSFSLILIIVASSITWGSETGSIKRYDNIFLIKYFASYFVVIVFSTVTEMTILYTYKKFNETNKTLEDIITTLEEHKSELKEQALHDGLTSLYNRRYFNEAISTWGLQALRHKSPTAIIMIDIDYFKKYNDFFGHLKGDDVLKRVAVALKYSIRRESDMLFRYGGEEFVILLTKTNKESVVRIANSIINNVRNCNIVHPKSAIGVVTVSVGVSFWGSDNNKLDINELLEDADKALYISKREGRNRATFNGIEESVINNSELTL